MENFSDEDFKKLEEDMKRFHESQKLEEELAQKDAQTEAEEYEEKIRETLEECDKIIPVLQEALDTNEIQDWMQAQHVLAHFEDKRHKALEEQERLREQERLSRKYGPKNEEDIEQFERIQKEEADMQRERSLVLLRSLIKEIVPAENDRKNMTVHDLLETTEKTLEAFRNRKNPSQ